MKSDLSLCERYGISLLNLRAPPQNYTNGQYEWTLDIELTETMLIERICEAIQKSQVRQVYQQRLQGHVRKQSQAFVCGRLYLSVLSASNLANADRNGMCDTFVQISVRDSKNQSNAKFIDIANENSFIQCKSNSEDQANKSFKTAVI